MSIPRSISSVREPANPGPFSAAAFGQAEFRKADPVKPAKRILIVDDEAVARRFLCLLLRRSGYEVLEANDGREAQDLIEGPAGPAIQCIVTDDQMPGLGGQDLVRWLNARWDRPAVVVITASADKETIESYLRGGAVDFLEKPFDGARLLTAVGGAVEVTARRRAQAAIEREARNIKARQSRGMAKTPDGSVRVFHHALHIVGGDFFGVYEIDPGRRLMLLTDVSGHGLEAGYVSAFFQGMVSGMLSKGTPVEQTLRAFNRILLDDAPNPAAGWDPAEEGYCPVSVALCAIEVDERRETFSVWRCGSPLAVWTDLNGSARNVAYGGSHPVGWFPDLLTAAQSQALTPNSAVYIWTDGLEDLAEDFGVSTLSAAHRLLASRRDQAPAWLAEAADDVLVARIALTPQARAEGGLEVILLHAYRHDDWRGIDDIQNYWARSIRFALPGIGEFPLYDLLLCLREAVLNAVMHGCREGELAWLAVSVDRRGGRLRARVDDPGEGYEFDRPAGGGAADGAGAFEDGHRGLLLMREFTSRIQFENRGATVTMDWDLEPSDFDLPAEEAAGGPPGRQEMTTGEQTL